MVHSHLNLLYMLPPYLEHYQNRTNEIETDLQDNPPAEKTIVLLGDSITEGFAIHELNGFRIMNQGISGDEVRHPTGGILRRIRLVAPANPAHVFVMAGINDIVGSAKPADAVSADLAELLMKLRKLLPKSIVYAQSVLPVRDTFYKHNEAIRIVNANLNRVAEKLGTVYLDLHTAMSDEKGELRRELSEDGLHINELGYAEWEQVLRGMLDFKRAG